MMSQAVQYMARTRAYYEAQGFEIPYTWAHFDKIPFTPLVRPLRESRVALITTAALYDRDADDVREVAIQTTSEIPERLYANDLSWDRQATHLNDLGSYFPLETLKRLVRDRRIGSICTNFYCAPTEYSHRRTMEADAPEILDRCLQDSADIALLVPL
tara:strand:- start:93 stop:566 length:474 start_codon:yes stop_codon:yes gene_type:complete